MSSTTNLVKKRKLLRYGLAALVAVAACGSDSGMTPDAGPAPTYTELYTKYFAVGTPGHCANAMCHADASNGWACGADKNTCYNGMATIPGFPVIDTANPKASLIASPTGSPLRWVNPTGPMPQDALMPFPEGRDAIKAWVAAGAQNN